MHRSGTKASEKALNAHQRKIDALEMRKAGHTFQVIADNLGYRGPSGAYDAVMSAIKTTLQEPADELRKMEVERFDVMINSLWPKVLNGDARATEVAVKVMERRAKMLGIDAPEKREDTHTIRVEHMAKQLADVTGLDEREIVAEAERLVLAAQKDD